MRSDLHIRYCYDGAEIEAPKLGWPSTLVPRMGESVFMNEKDGPLMVELVYHVIRASHHQITIFLRERTFDEANGLV